MAKRITVIVSQGQSQNPAKRDLEETIVAELLMQPGIDVVVVPHLYDLSTDSTGVLALQGVGGDVVVLAWLFDRAIRWTLDRHNVRGQAGLSLLKPPDDDDDFDEDDDEFEATETAEAEKKERVLDARPTPNRKIYCLDLRWSNNPQAFIDEVKRIAGELATQVVAINLFAPSPAASPAPIVNLVPAVAPLPLRIEEEPARRWYPVIDFSRCTNCMECIDFCLFGVYGVDKWETILVEQPDNCRKGCPACSRVCPENAIIFPQHKTPAIAGAEVKEGAGALKIDLSKLFGAPEANEDPVAVAARERDEQLMLAGREAVGLSVGIPKRQLEKKTGPKDELDDLLDALDDVNL